MSYTPTEWESTDVVTATRMNSLEQAVGDINTSYTPNIWSDGDILSAEKMNALEQAVASGGGGSSDFSTAEVTIINNANNSVDFNVPLALEEGEYDDNSPALCCASNGYVDGGNTFAMKVVLYKGTGALALSSIDVPQVTLSGNIMPVFEDGLEYYITGDCTITIS